MNDLEKAKKIFFDYSGSTFYMSRDGVEEEFLSYSIPESIQNKWLTELIEKKLSKLNEIGNWMIVHFLNHHRQKGYADRLISVSPKGKLWERCAYLEELFEYSMNTQKLNESQFDKAIKYFKENISLIEKIAKSDKSKNRVKGIRDKLEKLKGE